MGNGVEDVDDDQDEEEDYDIVAGANQDALVQHQHRVGTAMPGARGATQDGDAYYHVSPHSINDLK